jgi:uncharacterized Zn-finger protein
VLTTAGSLKRHTRCHTGEKPFACTWAGCSYRSTQSGNLQLHYRSHCSRQKPFDCAFRSVTDPSNLKTHVRTHIDAIPLICSEQHSGLNAVSCTSTKCWRPVQVSHTGSRRPTFTLTSPVGDDGPNLPTSVSACWPTDTTYLWNWEASRFRLKKTSALQSHTWVRSGLQLARTANYGNNNASFAENVCFKKRVTGSCSLSWPSSPTPEGWLPHLSINREWSAWPYDSISASCHSAFLPTQS